MKQFFNISQNILITFGENGAVIYQFVTPQKANIYNVFETESHILYDIRRGKKIKDLKLQYPAAKIDKLCAQLETQGIGRYGPKFIPHEQYRIGAKLPSPNLAPHPLNKCYIELPFPCNKNCDHCDELQLFGCFSCSKAKTISEYDQNFYENILTQLTRTFSCKNLIFYGGDVLAHIEMVIELIRKININLSTQKIYVILAEDKNTYEITNKLLENGIIPIINVDWPNTGNAYWNTNAIVNINVPFHQYDSFKSFLENRRKDGKNNTIKFSIYGNDINLHYMNENFRKNVSTLLYPTDRQLHPCLSNQIVIRSDKKIYLCKNMNDPVTNIKYDCTTIDLSKEILKLQNHWMRNYAAECQKCKYRLICLDCPSYDQFKNTHHEKASCIEALNLKK